MDILRFIRHSVVILSMLLALGGWNAVAVAQEADASVAATVNINQASAVDIAAALNGVGESRAAAIVAYREEHGSFSSLEDLQAVKGVGEKLVEKNASRITF